MNSRIDYTVCQWRISGLIAGVVVPCSRKEQGTTGIKHRLILGGWASDANTYFFYLFRNLEDLKYVSTENPHRPVKGINFATRDYFLGTPANFLLFVTHGKATGVGGWDFFFLKQATPCRHERECVRVPMVKVHHHNERSATIKVCCDERA